jgi:argininosuccinate lyase
MASCLDDETTQNMVNWGTIVLHPSYLTDNIMNFTQDFALATSGMEIAEDVMACHFEKSAYDLMTFCSSDATACTMSKLMENLSKNMFVIMGKMTSMAETMKDFPATDKRDFKE